MTKRHVYDVQKIVYSQKSVYTDSDHNCCPTLMLTLTLVTKLSHLFKKVL